ncbi:uncharacterized protein zgc:174888 [Hoplias malabaricus]|uniref:uncharacterized protein zgc:174888 n=1 Tax=Hoplias malabaricus TaxID=27720 RepID=UPI003462D9B5
MTLIVFLLLSIFTLRGRGCNEFHKGTARNFQHAINHEDNTGFPEVFPKNYVVPIPNASSQCGSNSQSDKCCVFIEALVLSHSWTDLLHHLERIHLKYSFIIELIKKLDDISSDAWSQETPDVSAFPRVNSSPRQLLNLTSALLSNWLKLNCPKGEKTCDFQSNFYTEEEDTMEKGNMDEAEATNELPTEGKSEKLWITVTPVNGDSGLYPSSGLVLWTSLRVMMDIILRNV